MRVKKSSKFSSPSETEVERANGCAVGLVPPLAAGDEAPLLFRGLV